MVDRLQWDVKLYLALNGAVHDAAIAAWGLKGHYDSVRPISMIRYMGGQGQSSDPTLPSYDKEGLPLVPGLIELITKETTAPGQRHAALAGHEGEIAILAWAGPPADPKTQIGGVVWILAADWVPVPAADLRHAGVPRLRLRPQHVQPGGRRGADGLHRQRVLPRRRRAATRSRPARSSSRRDRRRTSRSEWATYYDAADQAGRSRLWGGIHIEADDFTGRRLGSECGKAAWALAQRYYAGTAGS